MLKMLLKELAGGIVVDQRIENSEDVAAIFDDALKHGAKLRLASGFAIPLSKSGCGDRDIAAELLGRVSAEKEAVKEGSFALRELEVPEAIVEGLRLRGHERNRSLRVFKPTSRVRLFKFWGALGNTPTALKK